ncbi:hypothetical protein FACS1894139_16280 [Planctomycetales bacterium]|nr:hypothetical protein FACS1894139_16280 [Planctomycetales bacterium]
MVNVADAAGATPLHYAAGGALNVLKAVLAAKPEINALDRNGRTPIFNACEWSKQENMDLLIAYGADVNIADPNGVTPLQISAAKGKPNMLRDLLMAKADPNAADQSGKTALMWAAETGNEKSASTLIGSGAVVAAVDAAGNTALHYAARNDRADAIKFFTPVINVKNNAGQTALNIAGMAGYAKFVQELLKNGAAN